MAGILIPVRTDADKAKSDLKSIENSVANIDKKTASLASGLKTAFSSISLLAGATAFSMLLKSSVEELTQIENKLALVVGRGKELVAVNKQVFKLAQDTRGAYSETAAIFGGLGKSLKSQTSSLGNILQVTKAVQQSVAISGSSRESASAAIMQLNQGLASGTLRGEELNSVMEQTPRIAQAIADQLEVGIGSLRGLAEEGKITSAVVFEALFRQSQQINKEFESLAPTLSQGNTVLLDGIKKYIGEFDKGLGLSSAVGAAILKIGRSIGDAADNAYQLGAGLALSFTLIKAEAKRVSAPFVSMAKSLGSIFLNLGKMLVESLPKLGISKTLKGDLRQAARMIDETFLGGRIRAFKQFKIIDIFRIESDVEKAIRTFRRLSPKYWAASGFDSKTLSEIFSVKYMNEFAEALKTVAIAVANNNKTWGNLIVQTGRILAYAENSLYRYLGFTNDALFNVMGGNLESFGATIGEIVRGITDTSVAIWDVTGLIRDNFYPSVQSAFFAIKDGIVAILGGLPKAVERSIRFVIRYFKDAAVTLSEIFDGYNIFRPIELATEFIIDLLAAIYRLTRLDVVVAAIFKFANRVIYEFFRIYDEVIGNSWWTDTIESVINTSESLWSNSRKGIESFSGNVINAFRKVFDRLDLSNLRLPDLQLKVSLKEFRIEDIITLFTNAFEEIRMAFRKTIRKYPEEFKILVLTVGAILTKLLLPFNAISALILTSLVGEIAANLAIAGDNLTKSLFNVSLVNEIGYNIGRFLASAVMSGLNQLPKLINLVLGALSSAFRGFVENTGTIFGSLFSGLFKLLDIVGLAGPAGLLGSLLVGGSAALAAKYMGLATETFETLDRVFKNLFGKSKKDRETPLGMVGDFLFGKLGYTRLLSAIGLFGTSFGIFDNILGDSILNSLIAKGGLLYLMWNGGDGLKSIGSLIAPVVKPLIDALGATGSAASKSFFEAFFDPKKSFKEAAVAFAKQISENIGKSIAEKATPYIDKGKEFLSELFLGKDPSKTKADLKAEVSAIIDTTKGYLGKASDSVKNSSAFRGIAEAFSGAAETIKGTSANLFKSVQKDATSNASIASKIGGESGLLGRLFLGKYGKAVIVGAVLATFAAFATAAETQGSILETNTLTEEIQRNFKAIEDSNPFMAMALQVATVAIPSMLLALFIFRKQAVAVLSKVFDTARIASWASSIGSATMMAARNFKLIGLVAGAGLAAGALSYKFTDDPGLAIMAGLAAAELAIMFRKSLIAAISRIFATVFTVAFAKVLATIAAVVSVGGALYLFLFGKEGDFLGELNRVYNKVKEIIGLSNTSGKVDALGLSKGAAKFAERENIRLTYDLSDLKGVNVSAKDNERLTKAISELENALNKASEEFDLTGRISSDTRDALNIQNRNLANLVPKIEANAVYDPTKFSQDLQAAQNKTPYSRMDRISLRYQQGNLDVEYAIREMVLEIRRSVVKGAQEKLKATQDLDVLKSLRDTRFNASYVPLDSKDKDIAKLAKEAEKFKYTSDTIRTELASLQQAYLKVVKEVSDAERTAFGGREALPPDHPLMLLRDLYQGALLEKLTDAKFLEREITQIKEFESRLKAVGANFKTVGLSFDDEDLFAVDEEAFKRLEVLGNYLKDLSKELQNTRDVAERNQIIIRIKEVRSQVEQIQAQAQDTISNVRPQLRLKDMAEKAGIGVFSKDVYERLSDQDSEALIGVMSKLSQQRQAIGKKYLGEMGSLIPLSKGQLPALTENKDYKRSLKEFEAQQKEVERQVREAASRNLQTNRSAYKDVAQQFGVDFDDQVAKKGFKRASEIIDRLVVLNDRLASETDEKKLASNIKALKDYTESIQDTGATLQDLFSGISSGLSQEDLLKLSGQQFEGLKSDFLRMSALDKALSKMGANVSKATFDSILRQKLQVAENAFKAFLATVGNTGKKIVDILSGFGVKDIALVSNKDIKSFVEIEKRIQSLQNALEKTGDIDVAKKISAQLKTANNEAEDLTRQYRSFSDVVESISSSLSINVKDIFSALPSELQDEIRNLEDLIFRRKRDTAANDQPAQLALSRFIEQASFDVSNKIRNAGTELAEAIRKIPLTNKSAMDEFIAGNIEGFDDLRVQLRKVSRNTSTELYEDALRLNAIKKQMEEGLVSPDAYSAASKLFSTKLSNALDSVLPGSALQQSLKSLDISKTISEIDLLTSSGKSSIKKMVQDAQQISEQLAVTQDEEARRSYRLRLNALKTSIEEALEKSSKSIEYQAVETGKSFAQSINDNFFGAFSDLLKGKTSDNRSVVETFVYSLLDNFTNNVIDAFMGGLTEALSGKSSFLMTQVRSLGTSLFSSGANFFTKLTSPTGDAPKEGDGGAASKWMQVGAMLLTPLVGLLGITTAQQVTDMLGVSVEQAQLIYLGALGVSIPAAIAASTAAIVAAIVTSGVGSGAASALGLLGFKEGGPIGGIGTGTSDSNVVAVSRGEFIVNAASTRKYFPLIQAINDGSLKKYSEGGLVMSNVSSDFTVERARQSATEVNLGITGDISRQTKAEILRMLPQIAAGVNKQNRERRT